MNSYPHPWWRAKGLRAVVAFAPMGFLLFGHGYRHWATETIQWLLNAPELPEHLRCDRPEHWR